MVGSWAYADDETAPDLALLVADSQGPIEVPDSYCGIKLTTKLTDRLAAQAAAGREVRVLTGTPTEQLAVLIGQEGVEIRLAEIWMEFWFIRAGEQTLFAINFQDYVAVFPSPVLELTGTITSGLFDRAQNKFEEVWLQSGEDPQTMLSTQAQLGEILSYANARDRNLADGQAAAGNHQPCSSSVLIRRTIRQPRRPCSDRLAVRATQRRRPGRRD